MKPQLTKTTRILRVMRVLAWLVVMGFVAQAGAMLISFGVSWVNPGAARNLYMGLNLYVLRQSYLGHYIMLFIVMVALLLMKAYIWFLVTKTLSGITLANPFKMQVAQILERISYISFGTWLLALLGNIYTAWLEKTTGGEFEAGAADEFLFMAGLVFIFSQVFKRGVEIQSENELTV